VQEERFLTGRGGQLQTQGQTLAKGIGTLDAGFPSMRDS
jgi:hypothetical protein